MRWIDGFSATVNDEDAVEGAIIPGSILPAIGHGNGHYRELINGDLDTEWADATEVVLERLVGDISIAMSRVEIGGEGPLQPDFTVVAQRLPVIRMGLLVLEDVADDADSPAPTVPSLWDADDLEDAEWMWLWQGRVEPFGAESAQNLQQENALYMFGVRDLHIDLHVKRKIGRRDRLVLCHDWAVVGVEFTGEVTVDVQPLLRALVSTK